MGDHLNTQHAVDVTTGKIVIHCFNVGHKRNETPIIILHTMKLVVVGQIFNLFIYFQTIQNPQRKC